MLPQNTGIAYLTVTEQLGEDNLKVIKPFVILLYDRTSECFDVNECRRLLFTKNGRLVDVLGLDSIVFYAFEYCQNINECFKDKLKGKQFCSILSQCIFFVPNQCLS